MKSFVISKRDAGTRVDRFIDKTFENLPKSLMYKEIRKKNIKVNKKRCTNDQKLKEGDLLEIFVDPNMIEIYANNGEYVLSQAVYGLGETFSYKMEKKPEIYLWNE